MVAAAETLYQTLGVANTATQEEIRAAYRRLALEFHPDRHQNNPLAKLAAARLAALNAAYEVLSDPGRRGAYDAGLTATGGGGAPPPQVRRQAQALAVLLRAISLVLVLVFLWRIVPPVWRALRQVVIGSAEALAGTPAVAGVFLVAAAVAITFAWRRGRRRRGPPPAAGPE